MIKESCNVAQDDDVNQPAVTVPLYLAAHNQRCGSSGEGTVWGERDTEGGEGGGGGGGDSHSMGRLIVRLIAEVGQWFTNNIFSVYFLMVSVSCEDKNN